MVWLSLRSLLCDLEQVLELANGGIVKKKKCKTPKQRNWIAVHAFQRSGAGKHKSKKIYTRKTKHKGARK